jgi:hypothetical protein
VSEPDVTVEPHGEHVGIVTLHRPPHNYFDTGLLERIATAYRGTPGRPCHAAGDPVPWHQLARRARAEHPGDAVRPGWA